MKNNSPYKKIVCLTEESVEFLYAIGRDDLICGVSTYAVRPASVKNKKVVSTFTHSNLKKIKELNPDLVIGFSDIQKDIAKDLIEMGLNVYISNQRSLDEILNYLLSLGFMIGEHERTINYVNSLKNKIENTKEVVSNFYARTNNMKPKVYIEEWNEPRISGIHWFSDLVELCGGIDINRELSVSGHLAKHRFVNLDEVVQKNPDIILACWCGMKVDMDAFYNSEYFQKTSAVKNRSIFELAPEIYLQPGPAPIIDGIDQLLSIFGINK